VLTESTLAEQPGVATASSALNTRTVTIEGDFGNLSDTEVAEKLSIPLKPHGYSLSVEIINAKAQAADYLKALPFAILFILVFLGLQKLGLINLIAVGETVTPGTAFSLGLVASVSTCMAVVGGLVLSMSASFAKLGKTTGPQISFHLSRLVSFFLLGGVLAIVGKTLRLSGNATFILGFIIGVILLLLGLNLLEALPKFKHLIPTLPGSFGKKVFNVAKLSGPLAPILLGFATFFLPCGFTQAMQLQALTAGGYFQGGLLMLAFALGTLPMLALLSFGFAKISNPATSSIFYKAAGFVVLFFAFLNIYLSLTALGLLPSVLNLSL
jgi:sulfite exporter TauE/SafE